MEQQQKKEYKDFVTFEMTGSPSQVSNWPYKQDFQNDMLNWGFTHTTLTKETDLLVAEREDIGTGKWLKAKKYGIPIYTYKQVWEQKEKLYQKIIRNKKLGILQKKILSGEID